MPTTHYENLMGEKGNLAFYRAERFTPASLFGDSGPETFINDMPHKLVDLSMSGVAAIDRSGHHASHCVGEVFPIQMRVGNTTLHEGFGKVMRVVESHAGPKLGIRLTDKFLDLAKLATQYKDYHLRREMSNARVEHVGLVKSGFRLLCTDTLHLLRRYNHLCRNIEKNNHTQKATSASIYETLNVASEQLWNDWQKLDSIAQKYIEEIYDDPEAMANAKEYVEMILTPELINGPIWKQTYEKPLGYPGDYNVMNYVYSSQDEGESLYAKLLHRLGVRSLECIVTRKNIIQSIISEESESKGDHTPLNVCSVACGTAQEVFDHLNQSNPVHPINITLMDQDKDALTYAYERAYRLALQHNGATTLQCLHTSFTELMAGGELFNRLPKQDLLYSMGLFDYIKQSRARRMVENLYEHVAPGGLLVIGNLKTGPHSSMLSSDMICDWTMIRRTAEEMHDLARNLPYEDIDLKTDKTDKVYIISIRKPK